MDQIRWDALIGHLAVARKKLADIAPRVYPFTVPHVAANTDQLDAAEARLGHSLDPLHRELLSYGNGWPNMVLGSDMLGTDDLGQGARWDRGQELLDHHYEYYPTDGLPTRDEVYPILVDRHETEIMVLRKDGPLTKGGHEVLWLGHENIERWDNTLEWWLACIELLNKGTEWFEANEQAFR